MQHNFAAELQLARKKSSVVDNIISEVEKVGMLDAPTMQMTIRKRLMDRHTPILSADEQLAYGLALAVLTAKSNGYDYTIKEETPEDLERRYIAGLHRDKTLAEQAGNQHEVGRLDGIIDAHRAKDVRAETVTRWAAESNAKLAADRQASVESAKTKYSEFREQRIAGLSAAYRGQKSIEEITAEFDLSADAKNARASIEASTIIRE